MTGSKNHISCTTNPANRAKSHMTNRELVRVRGHVKKTRIISSHAELW